ncbi:MAG TPA: HD-GYP domain-containing protein [Gemmatimonadaceae bacterium]
MKAPKAFVQLVCIAALLAAVLLWHIAPPIADWDIGTVATLAAVALTAELMVYLLPRQAAASISFIPYMTTVLLVPNFAALAAIVGAQIIVELARRRDGLKSSFNTGQLLLTYALAIMVYRTCGGRSLFELRHLDVASVTVAVGLPMMVAYVVTFALNSLLVAQAIALSTNGKVLQVWRENTATTIGIDVLAAPIVFAFAWVYANYGPIIASLLWVPVLGVRQLNTINLELAQTNRELLELMVKSIEARDPYTSGHSRRVKEYAIKIAKLLGLSQAEVETIGTAALLHDVGKIYDKYAPILAKADRLTPEEWAIIKEHPVDGANLIATMTRLRGLVPSVRHHHENWDGTGYPDALQGEDIPLASRVIMFADTFDAMTTKRPYRGPLGELEVREELLRCRGRQFDPEITDRLLASDFWRTLFPPGSRVGGTPRFMHLISTGSKG